MTGKRCMVLCAVLVWFSAASSAVASADDRYLAGYVTAVLEREFNLRRCVLEVQGGVVTVRGPDLTGSLREKITTVLSGLPGVVDVEVINTPTEQAVPRTTAVTSECASREGKFFPRGELFAPLLADPRWPNFSAAYQNFMNSGEFTDVGAVSFGETFGLYRDGFPLGGEWQLSIQAAVFSIFDLDSSSLDLINSDFWVSFPSIGYRKGGFSALGRIYHQSSHLGDEYLLRVINQVNRLNLSYEVADLLFSYELYHTFRIYGGGGYLFHREPSDLKPAFVQYGMEFQSPRSFIQMRPVFAAYLTNREENNWYTDISLRAGVELESKETITRKYLLMLEYFDGYSPNGQFYERKIEYLGIGFHIYL